MTYSIEGELTSRSCSLSAFGEGRGGGGGGRGGEGGGRGGGVGLPLVADHCRGSHGGRGVPNTMIMAMHRTT